MNSIPKRPRRNRKSESIRKLVRENQVTAQDLVYPLFVMSGKNQKEPISSMPGIFRFSTDLLLQEVQECVNLGIQAFALFPKLEESEKDPLAKESKNPNHFYLQAIRMLKEKFQDICIISDVAMDPYSSHGHDGVYKNGEILNDQTLPILAEMALEQAKAGADMVAPSDMMDGRVAYLRRALDDSGFSHVSILSYSAKYASCFYGPFREALGSAPKFGDKKTYQMDPANRKEALREAHLDEEEGADMLMVKPALAYLDVISDLRAHSELPIVAYQVSGEYSMIQASVEKGWLDEKKAMEETLVSIKRAGADLIFTYFAKKFLQNQR